MNIHYNEVFNTYESCNQDINKSGKDIFLDGKKLYTEDKIRAMLKQQLKADKIALLGELQKEVNELYIDNPLAEDEEDMNRGIEKAADVIQQKINALMDGR